MGDEAIAEVAYRAALHDKPIQQLDEVFRIYRKAGPQNHRVLAGGALWHARLIGGAEFDAMITTTPTEVGSQLYDHTWNLCVYATVDTPRSIEVYTAMLALGALCLVPATTIEMHDLTGRFPRPRDYGMANWRGDIDGMAGNRIGWDPHKASLQAERSIIGPLASWALGEGGSWNGWNHGSMGWAMEAATPGGFAPTGPGNHRHGHQVDLPSSVPGLVALVDRLKMGHGQQMDILRLKDGGLVTVLNKTTHNTRYGVLVTLYHAREKRLELVSPAVRVDGGGGGAWTSLEAQVDDAGRWETWQRGDPSKIIRGSVKASDVQAWARWTKNGCKILKGGSPVEDKPPAPLPSTKDGLALLSLTGKTIEPKHPKRTEILNIIGEGQRRTAEGSTADARKAIEKALRVMTEAGW